MRNVGAVSGEVIMVHRRGHVEKGRGTRRKACGHAMGADAHANVMGTGRGRVQVDDIALCVCVCVCVRGGGGARAELERLAMHP